ncbi:MAG TPA: phytoene/squalene synthase family protein [Segeticoccus sp.]|uniref:phytoene/squalene synthase family protein n=1 Tax=Segeticoccus sp. TaxID=2706531 RepID=UPI002D7EB9CE|nr:phytoene/squalene synthase family protein [Segeticoccus sp.]HET8600286.1 phytoene/squalene synthase family protein [Segeticoccus sp.]
MSAPHERRRPQREEELAAAYEHCRRIHARHGRTYYLATRLLPRERRRHVWALYAFARVADELVDGVRQPDPAAVTEWNRHALAVLRRDLPPEPSSDPVLAATWHTLRRYGHDPDLVAEFLHSMAMDLTVTRYPTWADLRGYMRGSAAVIGELMAPVLGAPPEALPAAGALGEAFQLTNFVRDVAEDLRRGRIYLPGEDLQRYGVDEDELATAARTGRPSRPVRTLVLFEAQRARDLYRAAAPGLAQVDDVSRPCLRAAFTLYQQILDLVEQADGNVFAQRLVVPRRDRARVVTRILAGATRTRLTPPRRGAAGVPTRRS